MQCTYTQPEKTKAYGPWTTKIMSLSSPKNTYLPCEVFQNLTKLQDTNLSKILKGKKKELQKELNDLSIQLFS